LELNNALPASTRHAAARTINDHVADAGYHSIVTFAAARPTAAPKKVAGVSDPGYTDHSSLLTDYLFPTPPSGEDAELGEFSAAAKLGASVLVVGSE